MMKDNKKNRNNESHFQTPSGGHEKEATTRTTNLFSVWSILGILHTNTVQGQGNQKKKRKYKVKKLVVLRTFISVIFS